MRSAASARSRRRRAAATWRSSPPNSRAMSRAMARPRPSPPGLEVVKGVNSVSRSARIDARAVVPTRDLQLDPRRRARSTMHHAPSGTSGDRVERVLEQVDQYLLDPHAIAPSRAGLTAARGLDRRPPAGTFADQDHHAVEDRRRRVASPPARVRLRAKPRSSAVIRPIRSASSTIRPKFSRAVHRCAAIEQGSPRFSAKVRIAATGWLISCATPAVTWPSVPRRLAWASSSRASR
jgi:hypothetical protein